MDLGSHTLICKEDRQRISAWSNDRRETFRAEIPLPGKRGKIKLVLLIGR